MGNQLISKTKIFKYLKHAFGETIFIVLGILLALQIDNWNNNLQTTEEINGFLNNIDSNLERDISKLETLLDFREKSIEGSMHFMKMIRQDSISKQDYLNYFELFTNYNPWDGKSFQSNQSGFEALKSSGYLNKIQKKPVEQALYSYYDMCKIVELEEQKMNHFFEEMEFELFKTDVIQQMSQLVSKLFRDNETSQDIDALKSLMNHPAFTACHFRNSGSAYIPQLYLNLIETGKHLRSEIKLQLNE